MTPSHVPDQTSPEPPNPTSDPLTQAVWYELIHLGLYRPLHVHFGSHASVDASWVPGPRFFPVDSFYRALPTSSLFNHTDLELCIPPAMLRFHTPVCAVL
jgi:hypothetical protein